MSGFLHRLAARTLGIAPHIRPRAALPYAAPQADFPGQQLAADPVNSDTGASWSPSPAENHGKSHHQKALPDALFGRQPVQGAATPRLVDRGADSAGSELFETMHPIAAFPASPRNEAFGPEPFQLLPGPPESSREAPALSPDAAIKRLGDLETLVSQLLGQGDGRRQKTTSRLAPDLVPAIITAPAGASTIRTQASRERPLSPTLAAEPEAAPEVHITIGRLEVNPPSRPAPPPARAPRGPAPLSLSDYLARRNGGRS